MSKFDKDFNCSYSRLKIQPYWELPLNRISNTLHSTCVLTNTKTNIPPQASHIASDIQFTSLGRKNLMSDRIKISRKKLSDKKNLKTERNNYIYFFGLQKWSIWNHFKQSEHIRTQLHTDPFTLHNSNSVQDINQDTTKWFHRLDSQRITNSSSLFTSQVITVSTSHEFRTTVPSYPYTPWFSQSIQNTPPNA